MEKKILGLVISSDKGLCGAFNSNLLEESLSFFQEKSAGSEVSLILMGKKAVSFYGRRDFKTERVYPDHTHKLTDDEIGELARHIIRLYAMSRFDAVYIAYNEFKSILAPRITLVRLLPLPSPSPEEGTQTDASPEEIIPDMEPHASRLVGALLPLYVEKQIQHAFHESQAAEQAARMMAMDNATKSAEDLIDDLTLMLNKLRQASITKELLEIMTAVEALGKR
jgi:F-type H+-transporting ATPase subunit gamma